MTTTIPAGDDDDDDDTTEVGIEDVEVSWFPCSLYEGVDDGLAECSSTEMPLDWREQDGRAFTVYAKRLLSASESEGQLWLLHGGPGASGVYDFGPFMQQVQSVYPEMDVYTLDPRGTGYSEYLGCPDQEAPGSPAGSALTASEIDACISYLEATYGDDLRVYNTTNAAIDLAAYIHHTREDDKNVLIWGGSGGTFWGQRYLQMHPDQADGMILEGIVPADESLVFQDEYSEIVARTIAEMCQDDPFCSARLPDPLATLEGLYEKLASGHCAGFGMTEDLFRSIVDYLTYYHPYDAFVPALIYRVDRCDDGDRAAVARMFNILFSGGSKGEDYGNRSFSDALFFNESFSELWEHPGFPTNADLLDYLDTVYEDTLFATGKGYTRNDIYLQWPKYDDPLDDTWAVSDIPLLMIQGEIDPATPYPFAQAVGENFNGPHQTFVSFPYSPHNVTTGSPRAQRSKRGALRLDALRASSCATPRPTSTSRAWTIWHRLISKAPPTRRIFSEPPTTGRTKRRR